MIPHYPPRRGGGRTRNFKPPTWVRPVHVPCLAHSCCQKESYNVLSSATWDVMIHTSERRRCEMTRITMVSCTMSYKPCYSGWVRGTTQQNIMPSVLSPRQYHRDTSPMLANLGDDAVVGNGFVSQALEVGSKCRS